MSYHKNEFLKKIRIDLYTFENLSRQVKNRCDIIKNMAGVAKW